MIANMMANMMANCHGEDLRKLLNTWIPCVNNQNTVLYISKAARQPLCASVDSPENTSLLRRTHHPKGRIAAASKYKPALNRRFNSRCDSNFKMVAGDDIQKQQTSHLVSFSSSPGPFC